MQRNTLKIEETLITGKSLDFFESAWSQAIRCKQHFPKHELSSFFWTLKIGTASSLRRFSEEHYLPMVLVEIV